PCFYGRRVLSPVYPKQHTPPQPKRRQCAEFWSRICGTREVPNVQHSGLEQVPDESGQSKIFGQFSQLLAAAFCPFDTIQQEAWLHPSHTRQGRQLRCVRGHKKG